MSIRITLAEDRAEKPPLQQAREAWHSSTCPIDGKLKTPAKHWFCTDCWKKLPADIATALLYQKQGWISSWIRAMAMLKGNA